MHILKNYFYSLRGLLCFLRRFYHKVCEKTGLIFYSKKQKYHFIYQFNLENKSKFSKAGLVFVPVPFTAMGLKAYPTDFQLGTDGLYANRYGYWSFFLDGKQKMVFKYEFDVISYPKKLSHDLMHFVFADYGNVPNDVKKKYLSSNKYLRSANKDIVNLARQLKADEENVVMVMKKINNFVISTLIYANPISGLYDAEFALTYRKVDCGGFSTLFASLAMSLGVPCRIVSGFWAGYVKSTMHAWVEFMLPDGTWIPVDASVEQLFEHGKSYKSGHFGFVGSDRIVMSYGCDIPLEFNGKKVFIDILQNPYVYSDGNEAEIDVQVECVSERLRF